MKVWVAVAKARGVGVLPPRAERMLMDASRIADGRSRAATINRVYARLDREYPHLFK